MTALAGAPPAVRADAPALRADAAEAFRLARKEPERARALASEVLARLEWTSDPETEATAQLALGQAWVELHDLNVARRHLERARDLASTNGLAPATAEADISIALVLASSGDLTAALARLDAGLDFAAGGAMAARVECQRALILQRLGRPDEALEGYRRGLAGFRKARDRLGEARVYANRGLLHAYAGRFDTADTELRRAARLYRTLGLVLEAARTQHNIGFVAARRGDLPSALRHFETADRAMARLGVTHPAGLLDYCETLLRANLVAEARQVGRRAVDQLEASGLETDLAEARLLLAEVSLAASAPSDAEQMAELAQLSFLTQGRHAWAVVARYAWLRARWADGDRSEATMRAGQALADDLRRSGWAASATHARILAARIALDRGDVELADAELRAEARHRRRAPAEMRIQAWYAEALIRWRRGDDGGAESALRAGLRVVSRYRAALGATELRVNASSQAAELGRLGVHIALERSQAHRVLSWAERSRASTLRLTPVKPAADLGLSARLAELRDLERRLEEAAGAGRDTSALLRHKAALEDLIRQKTWHAGGRDADAGAELSLRELRRALGPRLLVEFVDSGGMLYAVAISGRRSQLYRIGRLADLERETESLRFTLSRLALSHTNQRVRTGMTEALRRATERLDGALFGQLRRLIGDRPLVIVPTGALHLLPWAALPTCRRRAVSVSPSAAVWLRAVTRTATADEATVLAAGPGIAHAGRELDALLAIYPGARRLAGPAATARSVIAALDGAGLAHLIAHGSFRADNPLFSSLRMTDGPLTVYELERLSNAPRRVVLSSCNGGLSAVRPDNELIGLSSALFSLGTTTVVASLLLVGDTETCRLMVDFHRLLAAGREPPVALAEAQSMADEGDDRAVASSASFVCLGA